MSLKIGGGSSILRILVATDTLPCTFPFALPGSTLEEMILSAVLVSDSDLGLEKTVDGGAPSSFEVF